MATSRRAQLVAQLLDELLDEIEIMPESTRLLVQNTRSGLGIQLERVLVDDVAARALLEPFRDELLERAVAQELIPSSFIDDHARVFVSAMCRDCAGTGTIDGTMLCLCATLRPLSIYLTARLITMDSTRVLAQERIDRERMPQTVGHVYVEKLQGPITFVTTQHKSDTAAVDSVEASRDWVVRPYPAMIGVRWPRPAQES